MTLQVRPGGGIVLPGEVSHDFNANQFSTGSLPSWMASSGTITHSTLVSSTGRITIATAASDNADAYVQGPQMRMSRHRGLYVTASSVWASTASAWFGVGIFDTSSTAAGGAVFKEDSDASDTTAKVQVRNTSTVNLDTPEQILSGSEYQRRRTITMLLYLDPNAVNTEWWCAMISGTLEHGDVFFDAPIYNGNGENAANCTDIGTIRPTVRIQTRTTSAAECYLTAFRCGVLNY